MMTPVPAPAAPPSLASALLDPGVRSALVIAHPAHEIRVFEWMSRVRPLTFVLTTGSRSGNDRTRLEATRAIIRETGARVAKAWSGVEDRVLYAWLMEGRSAGLAEHVVSLADALVDAETELVVADSWQLYNVAHDITHVIARVAASLASDRLGRSIPVVCFPVVPTAMAPEVELGDEIVSLTLGEERYQTKMAMARRIPLVAQEVEDIERADGPDALRCEAFHMPAPLAGVRSAPAIKPYYEQYGEARVAAGLYKDVIRWSHVERSLGPILSLTVQDRTS